MWLGALVWWFHLFGADCTYQLVCTVPMVRYRSVRIAPISVPSIRECARQANWFGATLARLYLLPASPRQINHGHEQIILRINCHTLGTDITTSTLRALCYL